MIERDKIIRIYDLYKDLLTDKQKEYFENYYFEDLSLTEIAECYKISKAAVGKTLNGITKKLESYESKLGLLKIYNKIEELIDKDLGKEIKKELENIIK